MYLQGAIIKKSRFAEKKSRFAEEIGERYGEIVYRDGSFTTIAWFLR